jgi:hypothetical protein
MNVFPVRLGLAGLCFLATACSNVQHAYSGSERPTSELGRIWVPQLIVEKFDGRSQQRVPLGRASLREARR